MTPSFGGGGGTAWTTGKWTSQLVDISILNGNTEWSQLIWREDNTSDETKAYVRVDILDSSDNDLVTGLSGIDQGDETKAITLNDYPTVKSVDIKIRFRLYSKTKSPVVSEIVVR